MRKLDPNHRLIFKVSKKTQNKQTTKKDVFLYVKFSSTFSQIKKTHAWTENSSEGAGKAPLVKIKNKMLLQTIRML